MSISPKNALPHSSEQIGTSLRAPQMLHRAASSSSSCCSARSISSVPMPTTLPACLRTSGYEPTRSTDPNAPTRRQPPPRRDFAPTLHTGGEGTQHDTLPRAPRASQSKTPTVRYAPHGTGVTT